MGHRTLATMEDSGSQECELAAAAHTAVPSSWLIRGAGKVCVSLVVRRELGACQKAVQSGLAQRGLRLRGVWIRGVEGVNTEGCER